MTRSEPHPALRRLGAVVPAGRIVLAGSGAELASSDLVKQAYLAE